jgi:hypothetical protein
VSTKPALCAGLESSHLNAVCARREQCSRYANWWEAPGVQFNLCGPSGQPFKHFTATDSSGQPAPKAPPQINQMSLFA